MNATSDIRITYFSLTTRNRVEALPPSKLPYIDLTCLLSGEMTYYHDGREVRLQSGDAILFPVGSERTRLFTDRPARYASFNVLVPDSFTPKIKGHLQGCITPAVPAVLDLFLNEWNSVTEHAKEQQWLLFDYLCTHLAESVTHKQNPYVVAIQKYIHQNLAEPLKLTSIAEAVHLAPEYCCALFKKHTGKTIVTYITDQRMDTAKRLFRLGNTSIRGVAAQVGFHDVSYFSKTFRKHTGMSPMVYCKSNRIV